LVTENRDGVVVHAICVVLAFKNAANSVRVNNAVNLFNGAFSSGCPTAYLKWPRDGGAFELEGTKDKILQGFDWVPGW
jgi:hypothetical protein